MKFRYQPRGIVVSSSLAISSSITLNSPVLPETASNATYALSPAGPTGSRFRIIQADVAATSSV